MLRLQMKAKAPGRRSDAIDLWIDPLEQSIGHWLAVDTANAKRVAVAIKPSHEVGLCKVGHRG